jgi:hypothetical protein
VRIGPELHKLAAIETTRRGMKSINEFAYEAVRVAVNQSSQSNAQSVDAAALQTPL